MEYNIEQFTFFSFMKLIYLQRKLNENEYTWNTSAILLNRLTVANDLYEYLALGSNLRYDFIYKKKTKRKTSSHCYVNVSL